MNKFIIGQSLFQWIQVPSSLGFLRSQTTWEDQNRFDQMTSQEEGRMHIKRVQEHLDRNLWPAKNRVHVHVHCILSSKYLPTENKGACTSEISACGREKSRMCKQKANDLCHVVADLLLKFYKKVAAFDSTQMMFPLFTFDVSKTPPPEIVQISGARVWHQMRGIVSSLFCSVLLCTGGCSTWLQDHAQAYS